MPRATTSPISPPDDSLAIDGLLFLIALVLGAWVCLRGLRRQ